MADTGVTRAQELDQAWVADLVQRWADAWNSHEHARVLDLVTEDILYDDSAWPATMHGHAEVRAFLDFTWRAFPDMRFEVLEGPFIAPGASKASSYWKGTGTHTGAIDPPGFAATGRRIEFEGADFFEFRDGRISRLRVVFDMMDILRQLGTMPPAGSPIEKAGAAVQRLGMRVREQLRR
jgi:steroid delta-isomerase-like uncharacterized protein